MLVWGIVLAGGGGTRFGGPKQYADLGGRTLLDRTLAAAAAACDAVVAVLPDPATAPPGPWHGAVRVRGGDTRAGSVRAGLIAVPAGAAIVVVADAAHPLATPDLYRRVVDAVREGADAAIPGLPLTEAVATVEPGGYTGTTVGAAGRVLVQTPQAFRTELLRQAHATGADAVEDASLVAALGAKVRVVPGAPANLHVTTPEELELARRLART